MRRLFFILLTVGTAFSQTHPVLYVASPNGLSLREGPGTDAKRIKLLEYGTPINNYTFSDGEWIKIDGYSGRWIKITSDGKTGYVFDGYTLPFDVPKKGDFKEYFESVFGKTVFQDSVINKSDGDDTFFQHTYHFKSGVVYIETSMYEQYEASLINLHIDDEKAYLLYYLLEETYMGKYHLLNTINYPKKEYKSDTLRISTIHPPWGNLFIERAEGAVSFVKIFYQAGRVSLTWGNGV